MTIMLLIVTLIFIVCTSASSALVLSLVLNKALDREKFFEMLPQMLNETEAQIINLLCTLNSSVNMLIYCFKDKQFRRVAQQKLGIHSFWKKPPKYNGLPMTRISNSSREDSTVSTLAPSNHLHQVCRTIRQCR